MTKMMKRTALALVAAAFLLAGGPGGTAFAEPGKGKGGHGKHLDKGFKGGPGKDHKGHKGKGHKNSGGSGAHGFSSGAVAAIEKFYGRKAAHCPPGLAKKNPQCRPPGQVGQPYTVGEALAPSVTVTPIPNRLKIELPLPPLGQEYVQVAQDVLLVSTATRKVLDAVQILSHVGK